MYSHEDIITPKIMHCKVSTQAIEFRSKLELDIILTKEQSVLTKITKLFLGEKMNAKLY